MKVYKYLLTICRRPTSAEDPRQPPSREERMHYSRGGALGWDALRLAALCQCADLVGCVLVPVAVGRGAPWPTSSSLRAPSPRLYPSSEGLGSSPGAPFREILTGPVAILEMPGVSGLRPCARTHLKKKHCAILVRLVRRKTNTDIHGRSSHKTI